MTLKTKKFLYELLFNLLLVLEFLGGPIVIVYSLNTQSMTLLATCVIAVAWSPLIYSLINKKEEEIKTKIEEQSYKPYEEGAF